MRGVVNICEPSSPHEKPIYPYDTKQWLSGIRGEDEIGKSPVLGDVLFKGEPLVYLS